MKRRIAVFTLIWAYLANLIWHSNVVPEPSVGIYLLPPGYFFVVGLLLGALNEALSTYWSRLWVTPAVVAAGIELSIWLYGGSAAGIPLGLLFALATLVASSFARYLARFKELSIVTVLLSGLAILLWLAAPWGVDDHKVKETLSPNGAFTAWTGGHTGVVHYVHAGPRNGWNGAFGKIVLSYWPNVTNGKAASTLEGIHWRDHNTLHISGLDQRVFVPSSALLPIKVIVSKE